MKLSETFPAVPAGTLSAAALSVALLLQSPASEARAYYTEEVNGYTVRCSTLNTSSLPEASVERYGVDQDEDVGIISCGVQSTNVDEMTHIEADVHMEYSALAQPPQEIEVREILENDLVSYLGTYPVEGQTALTFTVTIESSETGRVEISFDDIEPRS